MFKIYSDAKFKAMFEVHLATFVTMVNQYNTGQRKKIIFLNEINHLMKL
jgi:hypothetical protein